MKLHLLPSILLAGAAGAQQQPTTPVRQLGAVVAKSTTPWNTIIGMRALPGGRVLVNDIVGRKVLMLDSALAPIGAVADTTAATATAYSGRFASLIPFRGDSTLFVDPQSMSMMVIDPNGKITRVMSVPRGEDAGALGGVQGGSSELLNPQQQDRIDEYFMTELKRLGSDFPYEEFCGLARRPVREPSLGGWTHEANAS